ncbi:MAG: type II toxin-antitoxin system HicB family antitoxin [Spirochaetaceae bacterium]|nr:MAG: type II toxin-antitoxin system HicB family antitoxin [Spirochaetaceae bacterium]
MENDKALGDIERLVQAPYKREITRSPDGTWFGQVPELPGCMTEADTPAETLEMLDDAMRAWFETALELGKVIPEPVGDRKRYSGRFNIRVPSPLHEMLATRAAESGTSLNEYCVFLLSYGVGRQPYFSAQHREELRPSLRR